MLSPKVILIGTSTWASKAPPCSSGAGSFLLGGGAASADSGGEEQPYLVPTDALHQAVTHDVAGGTKCRTFTAAYMLWSSVAKEMRPRRMARPRQ